MTGAQRVICMLVAAHRNVINKTGFNGSEAMKAREVFVREGEESRSAQN